MSRRNPIRVIDVPDADVTINPQEVSAKYNAWLVRRGLAPESILVPKLRGAAMRARAAAKRRKESRAKK